ncbi:MAG: hypothetical protein FJ083_12340, partial [Cyanobacteria bacterium K_Offshore_surface_m2_239]|nr:hypothetical protein [Cyanobacteria bacterium K_Offshore_surface_m2_239]
MSSPSPSATPALASATPLRGLALNNPPPPALLRARPQSGGGARGLTADTPSTAESADDDLLSPSFVRVDRAFDLTATAREATASVSPLDGLPDEQVVVLELAEDGGTTITTAGALRCRQELWQTAKEKRLNRQRESAAAEQRERLRELRTVLAGKAFRVERCVRVASPARGTRLLGENLDIFLSVLLSLISNLPLLAGQPVVAVLKRLVLDVVRRRLDPCLVPGLAALAPDAPLASLLARLPPRTDLA